MTQKNLILAVETSSRVGSVAIAAGQRLLEEISFSGPMRHSSELFPAICSLLSQFEKKSQDIEQIHISVGPGSFTGLRIAVTLAKAMHLANSAKIVSVDTLDVIAANVINFNSASHEPRATSHKIIAPILDAKRGRFYIAIYQKTQDARHKMQDDIRNTQYEKIIPDSVMTANEFLEKYACEKNPIWLLGDGLVYHKDKFETNGVRFFAEEFWSPRASKVHQLGWNKAQADEFVDPLLLTPNYLIRPNVTLRRK
jgi:tRNA threonylcarbamoyladenosine biosynthesis protein TsaB